MKPLAFRITGELENQSPLHISTDRTYNFRGTQIKQSDIYPLGQNLRGAFGYVFLAMNGKIANTFENGHPVIYFRDALIKHHDGVFLPSVRLDKGIREVIYECNGCRFKERYPAFKEPMSGISLGSGGNVKNMFLTDIVSGRYRYRFEAIFNMKAKTPDDEKQVEDFLAEFIAALKFIEEHGLYIGKRNSKGLGKVLLKRLDIKPVTMEDIKKRAEAISQIVKKDGQITIHMLSDTLAKFPLSGEDVARDAKNAAKFFDPSYTQYKDPRITHAGKPVELTSQIAFLDMKTKAGKPKVDTANVVSRGTKLSYRIENTAPEFFDALAMAEQLRGLGDRTSFGKGEFIVS